MAFSSAEAWARRNEPRSAGPTDAEKAAAQSRWNAETAGLRERFLAKKLTGNDLSSSGNGQMRLDQTLVLEDMDVPTELFERLKELPKLRKLVLRKSRFRPADLARLCEHPELEEVDLSATAVRNAHLRPFAGWRRLNRIVLCDTAVSGRGLAHLARLEFLGRIDLTRTRVGNGAMAVLASMERLAHLILDETAVGDSGIRKLYEGPWWRKLPGLALKHHIPLDLLCVSKTRVTRAGQDFARKAWPRVMMHFDGGWSSAGASGKWGR